MSSLVYRPSCGISSDFHRVLCPTSHTRRQEGDWHAGNMSSLDFVMFVCRDDLFRYIHRKNRYPSTFAPVSFLLSCLTSSVVSIVKRLDFMWGALHPAFMSPCSHFTSYLSYTRMKQLYKEAILFGNQLPLLHLALHMAFPCCAVAT